MLPPSPALSLFPCSENQCLEGFADVASYKEKLDARNIIKLDPNLYEL